jgi:hypothetical protein
MICFHKWVRIEGGEHDVVIKRTPYAELVAPFAMHRCIKCGKKKEFELKKSVTYPGIFGFGDTVYSIPRRRWSVKLGFDSIDDRR